MYVKVSMSDSEYENIVRNGIRMFNEERKNIHDKEYSGSHP